MKTKTNTYGRIKEVFPANDGDAVDRCCACFSSKNNISTGVVVVLLIDNSLILVEFKQSRRRIFDERLNRSVLRTSKKAARNLDILRNNNKKYSAYSV